MDVARYIWQMNLQMEPYIEIENNLVVIRQNKNAFLFVSPTGCWMINNTRDACSLITAMADNIHADSNVVIKIQNESNILELGILGTWRYRYRYLINVLVNIHKPPNSQLLIQSFFPKK